ncbi:MAG TPA: CPBP family glutamic-type intramembrane protease [Candidatus Angelobacter sp.]
MTTPPPPRPDLGFDPAPGQPLPPGTPRTDEMKAIAPIWHTVVMVLLLGGNSFVSAIMASRTMAHDPGAVTENMRLIQYAFTIVLEFFLLFLVWIGLRLRRTTIRELIGGRWPNPEAFLLDVAIALAFWLLALGVIYGMSWAVGLTKASQLQESKKLLEVLAPHTVAGLALFVLLSTVAGFVEEIIFRGYLQRQLGALTGNIYIGLVASAAVFGASHGYEGTRRMVVIFVFGMMFGFLALWRKSLRPGMMAHAWYDSVAGVGLFLVARKLLPSLS